MNYNPLAPNGGGHRWLVLLVATAAGLMAAQGQAWANALATAAAVYTVMSTSPDRRS
ncbi:hypothetical protein ACFWIV_28885 [Streptomyces virginiae]|uniref:hypothetical protein n=1 Tax=Streptomyces virginiae TaxID=1961 RepID=UPI00365788E7